MIDKLIKENLEQAKVGRKLWLKYIRKNKVHNEDYVILFPTADTELNNCALLYLRQFILKEIPGFKHIAKRILILAVDERIASAVSGFTEAKVDVVKITNEQAKLMIKYYSFYKFSNRLIIVSIDGMEFRTEKDLLFKKGITLDEIVARGLYMLREFKKEDVVEFLAMGR